MKALASLFIVLCSLSMYPQNDSLAYVNPVYNLTVSGGTFFISPSNVSITLGLEKIVERTDNSRAKFGFSGQLSYFSFGQPGAPDGWNIFPGSPALGISGRGLFLYDFSSGNGHHFELQVGALGYQHFDESTFRPSMSAVLGYRYHPKNSPIDIRVGYGLPEFLHMGMSIRLTNQTY